MKCSFFRDAPDILTEIQWYFVREDTPVLKYPTPFRSRNWDVFEVPYPALGEAIGPRTWTSGHPPRPLRLGTPCGSEDNWRNGCLSTDPVVTTWPGTSIITCCPRPPQTWPGGIAEGGRFSTLGRRGGLADGGRFVGGPVIMNACCAYAQPYSLRMTVVSFSGSCSCWSTTSVMLAWDGIDRWRSVAPFDPCNDGFGPYTAHLKCHPLFDPHQGYILTIENGAGDGFTWDGDAIVPDCQAATFHGEWPMVSTGGTCGGSGVARFRIVAA